MYDSTNVAETIKKVAKEKGIQLKEMLSELNLNKNTLSNMYNGSMLRGDNLARIADYLNCSVDHLLGRPPKTNSNLISMHEYKVIAAYRTRPEIQQAVDILLNVQRDPDIHVVKKAARNGKYEVFTLTDDEYKQMMAVDKALEDAPDDM